MSYDDKIKSYYGIDPNKSLHSGYNQMIKAYLPKHSHNKYVMIPDCAEDVIHTLNQKFDLICTSPPYFNLEKYSDDKKQSIKRYPNFELWYNKFLLNSLHQCAKKLNHTGIIALNINDFGEYQIVDRLIKDVKDLEFKGIIYFGNPKCKTQIYQPILLWCKN